MGTDFIEKDKTEQSIYALTHIEVCDGKVAIRQLCLTVHYLQYRRFVEEYVRELLLRHAIEPEPEDYEDLVEDVLSELIPDDGTLEADVEIFPIVAEWAKNVNERFAYNIRTKEILFLARADGAEVLTFQTEEEPEDEE